MKMWIGGVFIVLLAFLGAPRLALALRSEAPPALLGWRGEYNSASFHAKEAFPEQRQPTPDDHGGAEPHDLSSGAIQLSNKPLVYLHPQFISEEEARHIITIALPRMQRSMVVGGAIREVRTSYGMFIPRYQDPVIARVQERVSAWVGVPVSFQEDMQVLRYAVGQNYKKHMDANHRMCTLMLYLTDTAKGGETAFPETTDDHWLDLNMRPDPATASTCARGHVHARPRRGDALLFYSMPPGTEQTSEADEPPVDPFSMHTGCPPEEGRKWTATFWVHPRPFRPDSYSEKFKPPMPDPATCGNFNEKCEAWASRGECTKNPGYMSGGSGGTGQCRLACGVCEPCPEEDIECEAASRSEQGFLPDLAGEFEELFPGSGGVPRSKPVTVKGAAEQEAEEAEFLARLTELSED